MFNQILKPAAFLLAALFILTCFSSCSHYCPAVTGTGNSATLHTKHKKSHCAGVQSTGTIKPKQKHRIEDGLIDPKMAKAMAKANKKNAEPVSKKTLSAD